MTCCLPGFSNAGITHSAHPASRSLAYLLFISRNELTRKLRQVGTRRPGPGLWWWECWDSASSSLVMIFFCLAGAARRDADALPHRPAAPKIGWRFGRTI